MTTIGPDDRRCLWMGRTVRAADCVRLAYPGVQLRLSWRGGPPRLLWRASSATCWFNVSIDGEPRAPIRLDEGDSEWLPDAGPGGRHDLVLTRRTESWLGEASFCGLSLEELGDLLAPEPLPARRLLFVGDSITCGEAAEKGPPLHLDGAASWNAEASYGMEAGRILGAQVHLVSYGGKGLVRDWQGLDNEHTNNAPVFFERALPDDPEAPWDHARYQPDAVVVCLGANDFNQGIPEGRPWVDAYAAFISRIRSVHPEACIVAATCPIFSDREDDRDLAKSEALLGCLEDAVAARADDRRVSLLQLPYQPGSESDAHPTVAQHRVLGRAVAEGLAPRLGWR